MVATASYVAETSAEISALVEQPPHTMSIAEFAKEIYRHEIRILTDAPARLVDNPGLLGAVRGAFGERLRQSASTAARDGRRCPWRPASALDVLWGKRQATTSTEVPAPYLTFAEESPDETLVLGMALFGIASGWSGTAADALTAACEGELWLPGRQKLQLTIVDREVRAVQGLPPAPEANRHRLRFLTPLRILRDGHLLGLEDLAVNGAIFGASLGNRATGFARWHGVRLDVGGPAIKALWEAVRVNMGEMRRLSSQRGSARTGRRTRYDGWAGSMTLDNVAPTLLPLLALGACIHAGGAGTAGLGRYTFDAV